MMGTISAFGHTSCNDNKEGSFEFPIFGNNNTQLVGVDMCDTSTAGVALPNHFQHSDTFLYGVGGGMGGGNVLFTGAQWQELRRQTMIYKYMMASIPVPAELLMSKTKNCPNTASSNSNRSLVKGSLELGFPSRSDPEPWRCRRTDGKKWRCSRDVVPDLRYCERHSQKTRPRSRKPVEVHTTTQQSLCHPNHTASYSSHNQMSNLQLNKDHPSLFPTVASASRYDQQTRWHNWYVRSEVNSSIVASPKQEWQHQMTRSKQGLKRDYLTSCCTNFGNTKNENLILEPLGFEYGHDKRLQTQSPSDHCRLLLGRDMNLLETQETRHFIDAWSAAERDGSDKCSALSLSMPNEANQHNEDNAQLCLETIGSERENLADSKTHWWLGSFPGGPLAEALCLGISSNASNQDSHASSPSVYVGKNSTSSSKSSSGDGMGAGLNLIN